MPVPDMEAVDWPAELNGSGVRRDRALSHMHAFLVRAARREVGRQVPGGFNLAGVEIDHLAYEAADDALMSVLAKLDQFRSESRFTTWAYTFVAFEVSTKLRRHFSCRATVPGPIAMEDLDRLPDGLGVGPSDYAERQGLMTALRRAVDTQLSLRQRQVFEAIVVDGTPVDTLRAQLGTSRNAIHQTMYDVRAKLRVALQADGYFLRNTDTSACAGKFAPAPDAH